MRQKVSIGIEVSFDVLTTNKHAKPLDGPVYVLNCYYTFLPFPSGLGGMLNGMKTDPLYIIKIKLPKSFVIQKFVSNTVKVWFLHLCV